MSKSIVLNIDSNSLPYGTNPANFELELAVPIVLDPDQNKTYLMALESATLYYTWDTISTANNNNAFRYCNTSNVWKTITIPDGAYTLEAIQAELERQMYVNGDATFDETTNTYNASVVFSPNYATTRTMLTLKNSFKVHFGFIGKLNELLGFNANSGQDPTGWYITSCSAQNEANISNGIDSLQIHCDLVNGSYFNSQTSDILHTVIIDSVPGSMLSVIPRTLNWLEVNKRNISRIRLRITSQSGKEIDLNGEPVTYTIVLRRQSEN